MNNLSVLVAVLVSGFLFLLSACSQPAYVQRNDLLVADGQLDDAVADYRRLIADDPEDAELYYQLAKVLYLETEYNEAIQAIEKAIIIDRLMGRYQLLAGKIKYAANDNFEAINHLTNALILNPQYLEAYYFLGLAHDKTGQTKKALNSLQSAFAIEPLYFDAQLAWAEIRFRQLTGATANEDDEQQIAEPSANKVDNRQTDQPSTIESDQSELTLKGFLLLTKRLEKALGIRPDSVRHLLRHGSRIQGAKSAGKTVE